MQIGVKNPSRMSTLEVDANLDMGSYVIVHLRTTDVTSATGTTQLAADDTAETTGSATPVKLKELTVPASFQGASNTFNIYFELKSQFGTNLAYARIYKNSSPVGTERSTASTSYVAYNEDIGSIDAGDLLQLWVYNNSSGATPWVQNFRIRGTLTAVGTGVNPTWS